MLLGILAILSPIDCPIINTLLCIIVQLLMSRLSRRLRPNRAKASRWSSHRSQVPRRTSYAPRAAPAPSCQRRRFQALQGRCPACSLTPTTLWESCPSTAAAGASRRSRSKQRQVFFLLCPQAGGKKTNIPRSSKETAHSCAHTVGHSLSLRLSRSPDLLAELKRGIRMWLIFDLQGISVCMWVCLCPCVPPFFHMAPLIRTIRWLRLSYSIRSRNRPAGERWKGAKP